MQNIAIPMVPFDEIKEAIERFVEEANALNQITVSNEEQYGVFEDGRKNWVGNVESFLDRSFSTKGNLIEFQQEGRTMIIPNSPRPSTQQLQSRIQNAKRSLNGKSSYLQYNLHIWQQCDLITGKPVDLLARAKYTMQQKLNFLLERLNVLNSGSSYFPLDMLLEGNGFNHFGETQLSEIGAILEQNGYVEVLSALGITPQARITVSGQMYVEENLSKYKEDYSNIPSDKEEINRLMDYLKEELSKLSAGQEVLFEELEDLRGLYGKLTKKNWGEILKGKMFDMALEKVISKETFMFILSTFTGHELKLLS